MYDEASDEPIRILHLEDSTVDHALVRRALQRSGLVFTLEHVETLEEFQHATATGTFDAIVADYRLRGFTAIDAWDALKSQPQRAAFHPVVRRHRRIGGGSGDQAGHERLSAKGRTSENSRP